jgi:hypothetical protein
MINLQTFDEFVNESIPVNESLPPGYSKFLVSLQTLIGDIAPDAWGDKRQIYPGAVKRIHNSLKKRYGSDYKKFNNMLKTQKGVFGDWYLEESELNEMDNYSKDAHVIANAFMDNFSKRDKVGAEEWEQFIYDFAFVDGGELEDEEIDKYTMDDVLNILGDNRYNKVDMDAIGDLYE